jgi:hypothetical protein
MDFCGTGIMLEYLFYGITPIEKNTGDFVDNEIV